MGPKSFVGASSSLSYSLLEELRHLPYIDEDFPDFKVGIVFDDMPDKDLILDGITNGLNLVIKVNSSKAAKVAAALDVEVCYHYEGLRDCRVVLLSTPANIDSIRNCGYRGLFYSWGDLHLI